MDRAKHHETNLMPNIKVIGIGGGGCKSVERLSLLGLSGVELLAINTDWAHLQKLELERKILIGRNITHGRGTGGRPELGEQAAEQARMAIEEVLKGVDLAFIIACLGGGTATGAAPVVAEIAEHLGAITVVFAVFPFSIERHRVPVALAGLKRLQGCADSIVVLDNKRLLRIAPNLPFRQALCVMDQIICEGINSVTDIISEPSDINVDFADIKTIMDDSGMATLLYGESADDNVQRVVEETLRNPLVNTDYTEATGAIIHVTAGSMIPLKKIHDVMEGITSRLKNPSVRIIPGFRVSDEFEGRLRIISIMTGVEEAKIMKTISLEEEVCAEIEEIP